ncbi:hypothetical protein SAMN05216188_126105 [Lentzea xinjiangensis]|uniref:Uncharacterized protein n=1 Tax=Lentzea xinjiangensis TaxID=402600 RepID=A0A1H9VJA9_9PSEU|nr:hypothetical protein [Lentzea xinjiangensis]SES21692.1 hypothetical protein SAMN05216188_126105 [Lentzea xinjiangensis]
MPATPAVAASSTWRDDEGIRLPSGDVHAWWPGQNQTLCGVPLSRARLARFPHVLWIDAQWLDDTADTPVMELCRRCTAATRPKKKRSPRFAARRPG